MTTWTIRAVALGLLTATAAALSGCHIDMWQQPKQRPYAESEFYRDRQGSRPLVEGTVAQGKLEDTDSLHTGKENGAFLTRIPAAAVTALGGSSAMLDRGEDRYNIYCQPCHGRMGDGNGFIAQRGLGYWQKLPATFHIDRLKKEKPGYLYDVLVNGKGAMYGYGSRIQNVNDRWAVVAYIGVLQKAHNLPVTPISAPSMQEKNDEKRSEMSPGGAEVTPTAASPAPGGEGASHE